MKKIILLISVALFFSYFSYAQRNERKDPGKKIEALEKIKLIESLSMDEETAIKFFARRNEHKERIKQLFDELDVKRTGIKEKLSSIKDDNDPELKKLIDSYLSTQQKLEEERIAFFNSLTAILTYKQLAELTLFERRFKEEIKDILFHYKKRKRN